MESKIKRISNFISQIPSKHTHWETESKSHQNIPMNLWDSNLSNQNLSLSLSFFLSQISEELEWNCMYPLERKENVNNGKFEEISLRKHDNYQDFESKILNIRCEVEPNNTQHTHSASFREKWMCVCVCEAGVWVLNIHTSKIELLLYLKRIL